MDADAKGQNDPADEPMPSFPQALPKQIRDEEDAGIAEAPREALCSMPIAEARAICTRLESEGIPCDLAQQSSDESYVTIFVRREHLEAARDLLSRPVEPDEAEDAEEEKDRLDRYERNWMCPRCCVRSLELRPTSVFWLCFRWCCVGLLALPFFVLFVQWLFSLNSEMGDDYSRWMPTAWVVVLLALLFSFGAMPRKKFCTKCGWKSGMDISAEK